MTTQELDNLAAEVSATLTTKHPDYALLAARIAVSNLHKETKCKFSGLCFVYYVFWCINYCLVWFVDRCHVGSVSLCQSCKWQSVSNDI